MSKHIPLFALLGAAISIFQVIKTNLPRDILDDPKIIMLQGYEDYKCDYYGKFRHTYKETCLLGVYADYPTEENVRAFYAAQMEAIGWVKIPKSLHKDPIDNWKTEFFLRETDRYKMERAITVSQNIYRGGVKLDDISVDFVEYYILKAQIDITPFFENNTQE